VPEGLALARAFGGSGLDADRQGWRVHVRVVPLSRSRWAALFWPTVYDCSTSEKPVSRPHCKITAKFLPFANSASSSMSS